MPCPGNPKATHAAPEKSPAGFGQRVDAMYPRVTRGNSLRPYFRELRFVERSLLSIDTGKPPFPFNDQFQVFDFTKTESWVLHGSARENSKTRLLRTTRFEMGIKTLSPFDGGDSNKMQRPSGDRRETCRRRQVLVRL